MRALVALLAVAGASCAKSSSPAAPSSSSSSLNLSGMWAGSAIDSSGPGLMVWQLTQNGTAVTGSVVIADSSNVTVARGSLSGTLSGSSVQFTITVPAGGFDGNAACTASSNGTATATATSLSGTYSGTQTCSGVFSSGMIALSKQ
jgi:hypothetical protein